RRLQQGCLSFRTSKQGACRESKGPAALVSPLSCQRTRNTVELRRRDEDKTEKDGRGQDKLEGDTSG
ncbi:hypothetical protein GBF38_007526, partial [Nibea albiflora]